MFIQCNFFSQTLKTSTNVNIIIPSPDADELLNQNKSSYFKKGARYQVLYLLHGAFDDYSGWQRYTGIEKYAQKHKIAIVMPSVTNSFYQNMAYGQAFFTYMIEELPTVVKSYFQIAQNPENTFIAGLSMGGYGAFFLALSKPENYRCAASLSGVVDICKFVKDIKSNKLSLPINLEHIFGNTDNLENTEADLFALIKKHKSNGTVLPDLFMTCGTEDFLYDMNKSTVNKMRDLDVNITYEEYPGIHDWAFWDSNIQRVLEWLPLKREAIVENKN